MSSWYFSSTPSVRFTLSGSSARASSAISARVHSMVSAMPGSLYSSMPRRRCTKSTIIALSFAGAPGTRRCTISYSRAASGNATQW